MIFIDKFTFSGKKSLDLFLIEELLHSYSETLKRYLADRRPSEGLLGDLEAFLIERISTKVSLLQRTHGGLKRENLPEAFFRESTSVNTFSRSQLQESERITTFHSLL